jgi:hypothetical protein
MPSLVEKFAELEKLISGQRNTLHLHTGVPFVLLIYDPEEEFRCREEQAHLKNKLADAGLTVREIGVDTFIFDHYAKIGLLEKVFAKEPTQPDTVYRDLAKNYRPALKKHIIQIADELVDPADEPFDQEAILFLTQTAHLYPFVRVANLLEDLENRVKVPLVVFYPGEELDGELRFLSLENSDGPHTKYRARRI